MNIKNASKPGRLRFQLSRSSLKVPADKPGKDIFIQNYMSIGVDALVTYNFHKTRENSKHIPFSGRLFNKLLYFVYGEKKCFF